LDTKANAEFEKDVILAYISNLIEDTASFREVGFSDQIGPETSLVADLGLKSIQMVKMILELEAHFNKNDLPFQELFMMDKEGGFDLKVSELVDFLHTHLNGA
jgi:acyl carrier protein